MLSKAQKKSSKSTTSMILAAKVVKLIKKIKKQKQRMAKFKSWHCNMRTDSFIEDKVILHRLEVDLVS